MSACYIISHTDITLLTKAQHTIAFIALQKLKKDHSFLKLKYFK